MLSYKLRQKVRQGLKPAREHELIHTASGAKKQANQHRDGKSVADVTSGVSSIGIDESAPTPR